MIAVALVAAIAQYLRTRTRRRLRVPDGRRRRPGRRSPTSPRLFVDRARPRHSPAHGILGLVVPVRARGDRGRDIRRGRAPRRVAGRSRRTKAFLAGGAAFIAFSVATTRVLLGVHWLTDVIAGLAMGWALVRDLLDRVRWSCAALRAAGRGRGSSEPCRCSQSRRLRLGRRGARRESSAFQRLNRRHRLRRRRASRRHPRLRATAERSGKMRPLRTTSPSAPRAPALGGARGYPSSRRFGAPTG